MKHVLHTLRNAAAFTALAGVLAASPLMAAAQPGSSQTPPASSTDGIIVLLDQDTSRSLAPAASDDEGAVELLAEAPIYTQLAEADLEVERVINGSDGVLLELDPAADQSDAQAFEEASKLPGVAEVYYNYIYEPIEPVEGDAAAGASAVETLSLDTGRSSLANDPYARAEGDPDDRTDPYNLANQYWLFNANVDRAWTQSRTEDAVTVAVLDSGCDLDHPDLVDNLLTDLAYDSFDDCDLDGADVEDATGHGTLVSGVIGATANNGIGIAGVSYNANILPIKVYNDAGTDARSFSIIAAYEKLFEYIDTGVCGNIRVVNTSIGQRPQEGYEFSLGPDTPVEDIIEQARNEYGIATVAAGGNGKVVGGVRQPQTTIICPSDLDAVISVTALNEDGTNVYWSDYNACKDISAPGMNVWSTSRYGDYDCESGTSFSSPIVAGTVALMFAARPEATVDDICEALYATATPIEDTVNDRTETSGSHGALDAERAVLYLMLHVPGDTSVVSAFSDVSESDWFFTSTISAYVNGYINGYADGAFGPMGAVTRGQVATILFNMANGSLGSDATFAQDASGAYITGFNDVDGNAFYAKAIAWAKKEGVVNGYADGTFKPDSPVSVQEFVCMLANYAQRKGEDVASASVDLSQYLGGNQTAAFALDSMEWAVSKHLIGNNGADLAPTSTIMRCRTATIAVNYQPKPL